MFFPATSSRRVSPNRFGTQRGTGDQLVDASQFCIEIVENFLDPFPGSIVSRETDRPWSVRQRFFQRVDVAPKGQHSRALPHKQLECLPADSGGSAAQQNAFSG